MRRFRPKSMDDYSQEEMEAYFKTEATEGPWAAEITASGYYIVRPGADDEVLDLAVCEIAPADMCEHEVLKYGPITHANAHLLSSAPDMIKLLEQLQAHFKECMARPISTSLMKRVDDLIHEARGRDCLDAYKIECEKKKGTLQ